MFCTIKQQSLQGAGLFRVRSQCWGNSTILVISLQLPTILVTLHGQKKYHQDTHLYRMSLNAIALQFPFTRTKGF